MKISLNIVKQYIDFDLPPIDELVKRINAQLGGIEEVVDLSAKYKDAKIVKVVECEKHPNADRLSVCMIDDGSAEHTQVVCGAPNVHAGMWAVWLPPESIVPSAHGTEDEFKLGARELRGKMSNGMLASARELGIGDDHSGIVEIDADEWKPSGINIAPGVSFAEAYGLDDTIIDIENKMFTHRPDLFGQLGVAREIAGIFGKQFSSPQWYTQVPEFENADSLQLEVFNGAHENVPRFMAVALKDVAVKPSPLWLQIELMRLGSKAINNVVDVTNYIMLLTAQPVHAYDYDKLRGRKLGARMAKKGEKVTLLNHKTYELDEDDIVIADGEGVVGLAGIMGGGESEVSADTKNIVLEVANFDMYAVRKSSMRHGIFTDALTRFNKGQSPLQNDRVLNLLMMSIRDTAGGEQASDVFDLGGAGLFEKDDDLPFRIVRVTSSFINQRLGLKLDQKVIRELLGNVEIGSDSPDDHDTYFDVLPPFWRTDIDEPEDVVEEVGRLYGFDKLPRELPVRSIKPAKENPSRELKWSIRELLSRAGANEVLTYSFVHERILKAAGQDRNDAYKLSNALSPDLQYYRLSLTPSLLDKVHANIKAGHNEFALFEIGKSHSKKAGHNDENLPAETDAAAFVYASKNSKEGGSFYHTKAFLEFTLMRLGIEAAYEPLGSESASPVVAPFEAKRTAIVSDKETGRYIGVVGEFKNATRRGFKLPEYAAGFELDISGVLQLVEVSKTRYRPLSRYPSVERDISLKVAGGITYAHVQTALQDALPVAELRCDVQPIGIYQPEGAAEKNITFRVTLSSDNRTLTSGEVNEIIDRVAARLAAKIDAERV